jgi:hypothetical protein
LIERAKLEEPALNIFELHAASGAQARPRSLDPIEEEVSMIRLSLVIELKPV